MKRILFAIPLGYWEGGYWTRDSGLVVLALRVKGYDAWLVALNHGTKDPGDKPVILASLEDMKSPAWWQAQHPDAVVLNTWSAPRYDAIRKAALAATPKVIERLDTDGVRSARLFPKLASIRNWCSWSDRLPSWCGLAGPMALAETTLRFLTSPILDARMADTMKRMRGLIAESPLAAERIAQILATSAGPAPRIKVIAHPVNQDNIYYTGVPKENRIITVGRWDAAQKDFPLVQRVLREFLRRHPGWTASVIGRGIPANARTDAEQIATRLNYHDQMSHEELALAYNRSKIYLMASRYESFCIASAEALCCGCSVVGSTYVASSFYFANYRSGQVASDRKPEAFAKALDDEVKEWAVGNRDPKAIAATWRERAGNREVAQATLSFLEEVIASQPVLAG